MAWLVMALVEGRHFPSASDPRPWDDLAPLADSLLTALDRLHWAGVLHRDLKPANVLVTGERQVTLVDLGLALDTAGGERADQQVLAGTPTHMAPELLTGAPPTVQTDLYAARGRVAAGGRATR